ncbi:DUF1444 family protein [Sporolactobacillus laevolacticus]|uniref:DUF1444 domain-containing protein n=1 Tax=Sporolactobacillus laevolacticus DSM 442 TaxID=1395513 RepID=V6J192_9BACL|nr:DUF1444 family protein [Sporolactobacillus laevolacticus]EST13585.1 hypothetical protein P343_02230 [Sporolactobacillus laevolacticus DSM 442]
MDLAEMINILNSRLNAEGRTVRFDMKKESMRIEQEHSGQGVTISLSELLRRFHEEGPESLDQTILAIDRGLRAMASSLHLKGKENRIFPVIRSASFPDHTSDGRKLVTRDHTAETKIFYALDLGNACRLIDDQFLVREGLDEQALIELASFNLSELPIKIKKDVVKNNAFYFIHTNDGFDASRVLNRKLVADMRAKAVGDLTVAIPHQDVLIFGDIVNAEGYDILAQMTMKFYTLGTIRITMLPFVFEKESLEPIFIMANKRPIIGKSKD